MVTVSHDINVPAFTKEGVRDVVKIEAGTEFQLVRSVDSQNSLCVMGSDAMSLFLVVPTSQLRRTAVEGDPPAVEYEEGAEEPSTEQRHDAIMDALMAPEESPFKKSKKTVFEKRLEEMDDDDEDEDEERSEYEEGGESYITPEGVELAKPGVMQFPFTPSPALTKFIKGPKRFLEYVDTGIPGSENRFILIDEAQTTYPMPKHPRRVIKPRKKKGQTRAEEPRILTPEEKTAKKEELINEMISEGVSDDRKKEIRKEMKSLARRPRGAVTPERMARYEEQMKQIKALVDAGVLKEEVGEPVKIRVPDEKGGTTEVLEARPKFYYVSKTLFDTQTLMAYRFDTTKEAEDKAKELAVSTMEGELKQYTPDFGTFFVLEKLVDPQTGGISFNVVLEQGGEPLNKDGPLESSLAAENFVEDNIAELWQEWRKHKESKGEVVKEPDKPKEEGATI
jgi:hypothetical protein